MVSDPDSDLFVSDLQDNKKKYFFCFLLFQGAVTYLKDTRVINSRNLTDQEHCWENAIFFSYRKLSLSLALFFARDPLLGND
jgi:hypothetical protein